MKKKSKNCSNFAAAQGPNSVTLGKEAEERALRYVVDCENMELLARNYRTTMGEIDLICFDANENGIIFIEVKSGCGKNFLLCQDAITAKKRAKIAKVARKFLENLDRSYIYVRFDAIFVEREEPYTIEHVKDIIMLV